MLKANISLDISILLLQLQVGVLVLNRGVCLHSQHGIVDLSQITGGCTSGAAQESDAYCVPPFLGAGPPKFLLWTIAQAPLVCECLILVAATII